MPERKSMRRIREVLRYHFEAKLSQNQIAGAMKLARSTVWDYLRRATQAGIDWQRAQSLEDTQLERLLFSRPAECAAQRPLPDWAMVHRELQSRRYVTLQLLWEEYRQQHPDGYSYPRFCVYYRTWAKSQKVYQRQRHTPGEKVFTDYSGKKLALRDRHTGLDEPVELLVMAWGFSQYLYAEAQRNQQLPHWTMGHVRGYAYFGCVPRIEVPDCLKSAVNRACRYDPDLNRTYAEMSEHYGVAVVPARPRSPRDKPKVENAVLIAQRWILAALRHRVFFSIEELNQAISVLLERANTRTMRRWGKSRRELFEQYDRPNAQPLPATPYRYGEWVEARLGMDCHALLREHFYSAPYQLCGKLLWARLGATTVEIFDGTTRVALHPRGYQRFGYATVKEHLPEKYRHDMAWSPGRLLNWATTIGPHTCQLAKLVMDSKPFVQQGFRPTIGILRLARTYGEQRLEAAAEMAVRFRVTRVAAIEAMLKKALSAPQTPTTATVVNTRHCRGRSYFAGQPTSSSESEKHHDTGNDQQAA
jgi:transposase